MRLVNNAQLSARVAAKEMIDMAAVKRATTKIRLDFERMLIPGQVYYPLLAEIHKTKGDQFTTDTEADAEKVHNLRVFFTEFLFNGSVLEYNGDAMWYDVHPIIQEIERFQEAVKHVESQKTTRKRAELDENERTLRELAIFVEEAPGFRLGLATYDTPQTRKTQLDRLAEAVPPARPSDPSRPLPDAQRDPVAPSARGAPSGETPPPRGNTLPSWSSAWKPRWITARSDPTPGGPGDPAQCQFPARRVPGALSRARGDLVEPDGRDDLRPGRPRPLALARRVLPLHRPAGRAAALGATQVAMPLIESDRLPREGKRERITLLRDLLVEMENGKDRDSHGNKARRAALWIELGLMFDGLAEPTRAIEHYENALSLYQKIDNRQGEGDALGNWATPTLTWGRWRRPLATTSRR
jgi:hypothetical protein